MRNTYIIASSQPWHKPEFKKWSKSLNGIWKYVSSPKELFSVVKKVHPRYIFFLHWHWIVPEEVWLCHECVCFHMTDVPYGRGGSPLQNLILAGKKDTKVTALRMVKEVDAGPVYAKRQMSLKGTAQEIYLRAGKICWSMIQTMVSKKLVPTPQKGKIIRFRRRAPQASLLPFKASLRELYDFIRMLDAPTYPLAFLEHGRFRLQFSNARRNNKSVQAQVCISKI